LLEPAGTLTPKEGANPTVEMNDYIVADVTIRDGERLLNSLKDVRVKVEKQLALSDGLADDFGKTLSGARPGEERTVTIKMSESVVNEAMRGRGIRATFKINEIMAVRWPELTPELLRRFGVRNEEQFQELIAATLDRRLEYVQRGSFRQQILAQLADASKWDLPHDLLVRQAERTLARRVMEMRSAGMSDDEILGRQRVLEQDVIRSTAVSLREHFVLQKIAELEKIEIEEADIDLEIDRIADRTGESSRKVRARMEKEDMIEALASEILEQRALDLVLESATYEDVELKSEDEESNVATVQAEAAPGSSGEPSPTAY
jgi:trigger factor